MAAIKTHCYQKKKNTLPLSKKKITLPLQPFCFSSSPKNKQNYTRNKTNQQKMIIPHKNPIMIVMHDFYQVETVRFFVVVVVRITKINPPITCHPCFVNLQSPYYQLCHTSST